MCCKRFQNHLSEHKKKHTKMSSESVGKKITELRVCDLKAELEKRGLETTGIKIALFDRLQKVFLKLDKFKSFFSVFLLNI